MGVRPPLPARDLDHVLEHTDGLWEDLRGERMFVTGGTGFFGGWMVESLLHTDARLRLGVKLVILTRNPDRFRQAAPHLAGHQAVTFCTGNVRNFEAPLGEFSHVLHLATETDLAESASASFITAVEGTQRVLGLAAQARTSRFLLASSGAIYGSQPASLERIDEDYAGAPRPEDASAAYGHGKRAAEFLCAAAGSGGLEVKIARGFAFVGPLLPLDANFAIGNFIRDALAGGPIRVAGDGTTRRSYLYAADLAIWLWTVLLRGGPSRCYNVGSERDLSIADLAELVARQVQPAADVVVARSAIPTSLPARYVPSIDRARSELQLEAWVPLEEGVSRTAEWYSAGPMRGRVGQ